MTFTYFGTRVGRFPDAEGSTTDSDSGFTGHGTTCRVDLADEYLRRGTFF
jgi:hypothetical protein